MSVPTRLLVAFVVVTALLVVPTGYATVRLGELQRLAVAERDDHAAASLAIGRFEADAARFDLFLRSHLAAPDLDGAVRMTDVLGDLRSHAARLERSGYGAAARDLTSAVDALEASVDQITDLTADGRLADATFAFRGIQPLMEEIEENLGAAAASVDRRAQRDFLRAEEISSSARTGTLFTLALALLLAGFVGVWATGVLSAPLRRLSVATAGVADGRFEAPEELPYERDDEIGDLSRSFRAMTQRLAELDRMKAEFVGVASHELKTPINVIMGYAELIDDELAGEVTEQQHEILRSIAEQCRAMTRLVSRLMDISRLEAGTYRLETEEFHVEDLLTGLTRAFGLVAEREGVALRVRIDESAPRTLVADVDVLRDEILGNLVSNALKFTPEGGEVRVTARGSDDGIVFRVSDTGPGIPEEHRDQVFQPYYQIDRSRKMGSGLGLAIVRQMTEAHGGTVALAPPTEGGAAFEVTLPLRSAEPASVGSEKGGGPASSG